MDRKIVQIHIKRTEGQKNRRVKMIDGQRERKEETEEDRSTNKT
jgi:hypothetical protein